MAAIKFGLAVFILFAICKEALGIDEGYVDGALGHGRKFKDSTVDKLGDVDGMANYENTDDCCDQCLEVFPATEMIRMIPLINDCICYKQTSGKMPKTFPDGTFIGTCGNVRVDAVLGVGRKWRRRIIKELYDYDKNSFLTRITITAQYAEGCCQACRNAGHQTTQLYEFNEEYQECKCFRKKAGSTPQSDDDTLYKIDICDSSDRAYTPPDSSDRAYTPPVGCFENDTDYPGMDINLATATTTDRKTTAARCQLLCQRNRECNFFTWVSSSKRCYLKSTNLRRNFEAGAISGSKNCY